MNRQTNQYAWAAHALLGVAMCLWMYEANRLDLSYEFTVVGAVAITLCGGFVTSIRANGLVRRAQEAIALCEARARHQKAQYERLIYAFPALHVAFFQLFPERRKTPFALHEFATWLTWALRQPGINLMDWATRLPDARGQITRLYGVYGQIPEQYQETVFRSLHFRAEQAFNDMDAFYSNAPINQTKVDTPVPEPATSRPPRGGRHKVRPDGAKARQPVAA